MSSCAAVANRRACRALNLKPGDKLLVVAHAGAVIVLQKPESYRAAIRGLARGRYPKDYLVKERRSWE